MLPANLANPEMVGNIAEMSMPTDKTTEMRTRRYIPSDRHIKCFSSRDPVASVSCWVY